MEQTGTTMTDKTVYTPPSLLSRLTSLYGTILSPVGRVQEGSSRVRLQCSKCGKGIANSWVFCKRCSAVIVRVSSNSIAETTPLLDKSVTVKKDRVPNPEGGVMRPRCPNCQKPLSSTWERCKGCNSRIIWE